jgi:hypothetical protein
MSAGIVISLRKYPYCSLSIFRLCVSKDLERLFRKLFRAVARGIPIPAIKAGFHESEGFIKIVRLLPVLHDDGRNLAQIIASSKGCPRRKGSREGQYHKDTCNAGTNHGALLAA